MGFKEESYMMITKFETSTRRFLSKKWGRTALCGAIAVPTGAVGGAVIGAITGTIQVGMAITAPISYPLTGFIIGKAAEFGFDYVAQTEEDETARMFSNIPYGKILATGNIAIIPFAPLKVISGLAAPIVGAAAGATAGFTSTAMFHSLQGEVGNIKVSQIAKEWCDDIFGEAA